MALQSVNAESYRFAPSALLSLYEIDSRYSTLNGQQLFFHPGVNGLYQPVVFDGITYTPFPIEVNEMQIDGKGTVPRPKLVGSNINGFLSQYLLTQGDLVGARFIRRRVFARFIDGINFANGINPFGTPDPSAAYEDDIYFVNRKIKEDPITVEFECVSPFELDNVQLPYRKVTATSCVSAFRDPETCGYAGDPISDRFGKSFTDALPDGYGYTLSPKGIWSSLVTYQVGDWVSVVSQNDFTFGETFVYVCSVANTVGTSNNPQFNQTNWVQDACPHNLAGCKAHFPVGALPQGSFAGVSRASYVA